MAGAKTHEMLFTLAAKQQASFGSAFSGARQQFQALYKEAAELSKQQNDISAYERQRSAVESTQNSLDRYEKKLAAAREALAKMAESGNASAQSVAKFQNQEAEMAFKVSETKRMLTEQTEKLDNMGAALEAAGVDTGNLGARQSELVQELQRTKAQMDEIDSNGDFMQPAAASLESFAGVAAAVGAGAVFTKIAEDMKVCADAAADYEVQMAAVRRTVGGGDDFLAGLSDSLLAMSVTMPITTEELAGIATTAGQLGIAQENVEQFTAVMAQLATTTDLTAEDAATMLAQFANITGLTDYERLGSTVAELGDATATTASKVVAMSQGIAAAASIAGMSETDILAISAAVGSLGIEAQAGSTAMSTLIQTLYKAVESGGDDLESFASVAGMTAQEFASAWSGDPVSAMDAFIQGLNDTERNGQSAIMILDKLGITNVRQTKAILGLASAGDLLSNTIAQANAAWEQNTALGAKADVMYGTTTAKLQEMQNAYNNLKVAIGNNYLPALGSAYAAGAHALEGITGFVNENPQVVAGITATTAAMGGLTTAITVFNAAKAVASKIGLASLLPAAGAIAAVGAAAAVVGTLAASIAKANKLEQEAHDAAYELTYASRAQADEIANLTAQYDAMVAAGEGNSAEAVLLKNHIEELTAEFERGVESVDNFTARLDAVFTANADLWSSYHNTIAALDDQEVSTGNLIARLMELSAQSGRTAADEVEMSAIIDELNSRYSDLNLTLDDVTGKNPISLEMIAAAAKAADEQERYNDAAKAFGQGSIAVEGLQAAWREALDQMRAAEQAYNDALAEAQAAVANGTYTEAMGASVKELLLVYQDAQAEFNTATEQLRSNAFEMQNAAEVINGFTEAQEGANDIVTASGQTYAEIEAELANLAAAYISAYDAALEAFQGQFDLFDRAPQIVAEDVDAMIAAMDSQTAYWNSYGENLTALQEKISALGSTGYDTAAIEAYVSAVNDGSAQGAALIAALASANEEDLQAIGESYTAVQEAQEATALQAADMEVGFSAAVEAMAQAMSDGEADISSTMAQLAEDMNKAAEAGVAGTSTAQAYINSILAKAQAAYNAGQTLARNAKAGMQSEGGVSVNAYATGTEKAAPGWAWVGEAGPELLRMRGGEQILNHEQSMSLMNQMEEAAAYAETSKQMREYEGSQQPIEMDYDSRGSYTEVTVAPVIQITGVGSQSDMQAISDELVDRITETVMDAMEEANINSRRAMYR